MKGISRNQAGASLWLVRAWFKKCFTPLHYQQDGEL